MSAVSMQTTTIEISPENIDYKQLSAGFEVICYAVPDAFKFRKDKAKFGKLHTEVKRELGSPYYFYSYDTPTPGLYVLKQTTKLPSVVRLSFLGNAELPYEVRSFNDLRPHVLLRLLLSHYFMSQRDKFFSAHGKHYIQAKRKGSTTVCLEIELKGDRENHWVFKTIGRATNFRTVRLNSITEFQKYAYPFFGKTVKKGQILFHLLDRDEIDQYQGDIYRRISRSDQRATLNYHAVLDYEKTRGAILHSFIKSFITYLREHGIVATQRVRNFVEYRPQLSNADLPIGDLRTVYVVDNRLNRNTILTSKYCDLLNSNYSEEFGVQLEELTDAIELSPEKPLLVLQDCNKADFDSEASLANYDDPYQLLYRQYIGVPKQTININPNDGSKYGPIGAEEYLRYPLISIGQSGVAKSWDRRLRVCFNELYLKHTILNQGNALQLPGIAQPTHPLSPHRLVDYAYIRKSTVKGTSYTTLLYLQNGHLCFVDLRAPEGKRERDTLLESYGLDWADDILEPLCCKNYGNSEMKIARYDFIIGPSQVVEIEDMEERVLYAYDEIHKRRQALEQQYSIDELKLSPYAKGILPKSPIASSVTLAQLESYDAFLDELISYGVHRVSYDELTKGRYRTRVFEIFDIQPNKNGRYSMTKFKRCYQRLGMFLSEKSKEVISGFQGIWYDNDNCFMVGSADSLKDRQPKAHLIRRFDIYKGEDEFNIPMFLETMAVKFVRYNQFTVYPYYFHFIDMYVDTMANEINTTAPANQQTQPTTTQTTQRFAPLNSKS